MKSTLIFISAIFYVATAFTQKSVNPGMAELSEKVIGWDKIMQPNGNAATTAFTINGNKYTAKQLSLIDTFTNWIRKSYIPIGALPQPSRWALPDREAFKEYLPLGTGVKMLMWVPCYDETGKKITRAQPASASSISILTNYIPGKESADWFNTPSQYYFTMYYDKKGNLLNDEDSKLTAPHLQEIKSKIGNYMVYFTGRFVNVILMPGKELPIVQITIGEVLTQGEAAVKRAFDVKKISLNLQTEFLGTIKLLKEKYKQRLNEPAFINNAQLGIYQFNSGKDIFERKQFDRYMFPVYKIEPAMYGLSRQDTPQLISISWENADNKSSTAIWEIWKAMTTNFNFQFVYDYFFNPEKVNGKTYQPLNVVSEQAYTKQVEKKQTNSAKAKSFPAGIHFMEDFSTTSDKSMPAGWSSTKSNRVFTITTLSNEKGKWLELDRQADIIPTSMQKPLPPNFTLDYDIATSDFTTRTGGDITMELSDKNNGTIVSFNITPANAQYLSTYASTATLKLQLPRSIKYDAIYTSITFNDFNSQKRKAHITIKKSGNQLRIFINEIQMPFLNARKEDISRELLLPAGTSFNSLIWKDWTTDISNKSYISNIKISIVE